MFYKFHTTPLNRCESYTDSPKKQKSNNNRCFQYAVTVVLNHESIGAHPERISFYDYSIYALINLHTKNFPARARD